MNLAGKLDRWLERTEDLVLLHITTTPVPDYGLKRNKSRFDEEDKPESLTPLTYCIGRYDMHYVPDDALQHVVAW
jgi:hypothetical protein